MSLEKVDQIAKTYGLTRSDVDSMYSYITEQLAATLRMFPELNKAALVTEIATFYSDNPSEIGDQKIKEVIQTLVRLLGVIALPLFIQRENQFCSFILEIVTASAEDLKK